MKSKILLLIALVISVLAQAQTRGTKDSPVSHKDSLYSQFTIGPDHSMSENTDMSETSRLYGIRWRTIRWFGSYGVGREFTNVFGWRATVAYNENRGACNWYDNPDGSRYVRNNHPWFYNYSDIDAFADLTVDLLDLFNPSRRYNRFDFKGFGGIGVAYVFGLPSNKLNGDNYVFSKDNGVHFGIHIGWRAGYYLSRNLLLGAELTLGGFEDKFSGYKYKFPLDLRQNLGFFVAYNFSHKKQVAPTPEPVPVVIEPVQFPVNQETPIVYSPKIVFVTPMQEARKHRELNGSAFLDFVVNKTDINPTYRKNPTELAKIRSSIDVVKNDPTVSITSIGIHGYASPEGSYANNVRLAKGRAASLRQYLLDVYNMNDGVITSTSTPEDWAGLRKAVAEGSYAEKDAILAIIDSDLKEDPKELKLKKTYPVIYKNLLQNVYPGLRHSDYTIKYDVRDFTVEEAKEVIKTHPENLSQSEMFAVANSYGKGTEGYENALLTAVKTFPNDATANMNVASMYLENGDVASAEKYFDKMGDSAQADYIRGIAEAMKKNYDAAAPYFQKAKAAGILEADDALKQIRK